MMDYLEDLYNIFGGDNYMIINYLGEKWDIYRMDIIVFCKITKNMLMELNKSGFVIEHMIPSIVNDKPCIAICLRVLK